MTTIFDQHIKSKSCQGCKFAGSDPDGDYCGHQKSIKVSGGFGRSWSAARRDETICGQSGKLFKPMAKKRAKALGLLDTPTQGRYTPPEPRTYSRIPNPAPAHHGHSEHDEIMREICGFSGSQD